MGEPGCPSPHSRPLPGGTRCLLTWKMSAGGRPGVATAGNGPSTDTDPPASFQGSFLHPSAQPLGAAQPCANGQGNHCPCTCAQHREGSPVQHRGAKVSPRQGKAGKCPHVRHWSSALYQRLSQATEETAAKSRDKDTGAPAQPPVASVGTPPQQGQPGRAQPAAPHSCRAEPLRWHGHTELGCTERSGESGAALQTAPKTRQHNPMPQTQLECADLSSGHCPVWPQLPSLLGWAVQPGSHGTPGHLQPGGAAP